MLKKDREIVAFMSGCTLPEHDAHPAKKFTPGQIVAFVQAADPSDLRDYSNHCIYGKTFQKSMEKAFADYKAAQEAV